MKEELECEGFTQMGKRRPKLNSFDKDGVRRAPSKIEGFFGTINLPVLTYITYVVVVDDNNMKCLYPWNMHDIR